VTRHSHSTAAIVARMLPADEQAPYLAARTPPSTARVRGGHLARALGDAWEAWLSGQHKAAEMAGIAYARHVGPPIAYTGRGGTDIRVVGTAPADYQGAIRGEPGAPWLPLAVEAKSREGRLQRDDIAPHQREDLTRVAAHGGVALVVIELHETGQIAGLSIGRWAVPWEVLETLWRRTSRKVRGKTIESASVGPYELYEWQIRGLYLDRFAGGV
jgi:hypothetical protein